MSKKNNSKKVMSTIVPAHLIFVYLTSTQKRE